VGDCPETYFSYDYLSKLLELKRFDAVCAGLQRFTEEMLTTWVSNCIEKTGIRKLALSGGVFMNVKVNQAIMNLPEVDSLFIYPSCGDETNAMGAAYWAYAQHADAGTMAPLDNLYLGRTFDDDDIAKVLKDTDGLEWEYFEDVESEAARLLNEGQVVARFKGRGEFGARALGNRSIMGDPCRDGVIREINDMIKSRDFWMPFAPSMVPEAAEQYLINKKKIDAPYMILAFDTTEDRGDLPAALHPYDFTARPQVVTKQMNPDYHRLIQEFRKRTGRGVILNTSFNLHGFPIVDTPEDAIDVLKNSGLRYLALGNYIVRKT
jgi:carbamoyltransferase